MKGKERAKEKKRGKKRKSTAKKSETRISCPAHKGERFNQKKEAGIINGRYTQCVPYMGGLSCIVFNISLPF